ncbi:MAG: hypothetical protein J7K23_08000 [Thermoproteales archaeon]|nr:hypothetical protein [Thermoproteales archaeon]
MNKYTGGIHRHSTIKVPVDIKKRLEAYARPRRLTLALAINKLLEDDDILEMLDEIKALISRQNELLEKNNLILNEILSSLRNVETVRTVEKGDSQDLPVWARDNPWIEVLGKRR